MSEFIDFEKLGWKDSHDDDESIPDDKDLENKLLEVEEYKKLMQICVERGWDTEETMKVLRYFETAKIAMVSLKMIMDDIITIKDLNDGDPLLSLINDDPGLFN